MPGPEAKDGAQPSPADFAASAAKLLGSSRPPARLEPVVSITGGPPAPATAWRLDHRTQVPPERGLTSSPVRTGARAGHGIQVAAGGWPASSISLMLVAAAVLTVELSRREHPASVAARPGAAAAERIAAETVARSDAVAWVTSQVGRYIIVACDAVMCSDLAQHGIPAADLQVLQPTSPDPYGGVLIIATADIRSQFGGKLASVYAPQVIASFGTGTNRIDIRVVAQMGPAAFRTALTADLAARRRSGAELLHNKRVTVWPSARAPLAAGRVDLRLLTTIASLASQQPVDIAGFGTSAPGGSPAVPLRFAYLAASDQAGT